MKPRSIEIRTIATNDEPLAHVLLFVTFVARRKNDFGFPVLTDEEGRATIGWEDILQQMEDDSKMFLMDYVADPENLTGEIRFLLENREETKQRIKHAERFADSRYYADSAENLRNLLARSMKFEGTTTIKKVFVDDAEDTDPFHVRITVP